MMSQISTETPMITETDSEAEELLQVVPLHHTRNETQAQPKSISEDFNAKLIEQPTTETETITELSSSVSSETMMASSETTSSQTTTTSSPAVITEMKSETTTPEIIIGAETSSTTLKATTTEESNENIASNSSSADTTTTTTESIPSADLEAKIVPVTEHNVIEATTQNMNKTKEHIIAVQVEQNPTENITSETTEKVPVSSTPEVSSIAPQAEKSETTTHQPHYIHELTKTTTNTHAYEVYEPSEEFLPTVNTFTEVVSPSTTENVIISSSLSPLVEGTVTEISSQENDALNVEPLQKENLLQFNETSTPDNTLTNQEVTTETLTGTEMTKIFSEIHKILDQNNTTEKSTETKEEVTVPSTQPPRLDNDEKNVTNPIEENNSSENVINITKQSETSETTVMPKETSTSSTDNSGTTTTTATTTTSTTTTTPKIEATPTETIRSTQEINEANTDYNDLLASSTEHTENAVIFEMSSSPTKIPLLHKSSREEEEATTVGQEIFVTPQETIKSIDDDFDLSVIPLNSHQEEKHNEFENDIENAKFNDDDLSHNIVKNNVDITTSTEISIESRVKTIDSMNVEESRMFSKCASGQYQCVNGTAVKDGSYCIPRNARCDSVDDCSDGSDEIGCAEEKCLDNFQCKSGQCLKRALVCDGIINCNDGSDEENCDMWECRFDEMSCGKGSRCIPLNWRCDGRAHCKDKSDERECTTTHCANNEYHCVNQNICIPATWRCDGQSDCAFSEDEKLCECSLDQFKCESGGCVNNKHRCDGIDQCADKSDEWNCIKIDNMDKNDTTTDSFDDNEHTSNNSKMFLQILSNDNRWHYVCSDNWNNTHSDLACQALGYANSVYTEHTYSKSLQQEDIKFLRLRTEGISQKSKLLSRLESADTCNNVVSIACQEFTCGSHYSSETIISARIIGGNGAVQSQWPSITLLYNQNKNRKCTASLIAPRWVIAGYTCLRDESQSPLSTDSPADWILYAGGTYFDINKQNTTGDVQIKKIKNIIVHPQAKFTQFMYKNDVVLIELDSPVILGRNVSAICLPEQDIEPRQLCVVAGWGVNKPGVPKLQQYLNYLPVPTIDMDQCNSTKHYNGQLSNDKICAGYTDAEKSPCYNDEGAPLMCFSHSENTWELQGVLSHHGNCGRSRHPSVYTAISAHVRNWIVNTVGSRAFMHKRQMFNV